MITHTAFFGDAEYPFALTDPLIVELERITDTGLGALYMRTVAMQFTLSDISQTIRLGLIGGMMAPAKAAQLVDPNPCRDPKRLHSSWHTANCG
jgi:hypothetical protein